MLSSLAEVIEMAIRAEYQVGIKWRQPCCPFPMLPHFWQPGCKTTSSRTTQWPWTGKVRRQILSQVCLKTNFSTRQAEWALHGLALLSRTSWPGFLQLSSFSNCFPACRCWFSEVHQRAKSYQVNSFFLTTNQPLAQCDQPNRLGHQADYQDGKADLSLQQGLPGGSGGFRFYVVLGFRF